MPSAATHNGSNARASECPLSGPVNLFSGDLVPMS
jgi:hypothetical protein